MLDGQTPKWMDRLEHLMPGLGIPNLALYLVGAQGLGFLFALANPRTLSLLVLDPYSILHGELWRLITFLAIPLTLDWFWFIFAAWFLYFIVNIIEQEWGEFHTTLYVLVAVLLTIAFSFAFNWQIWSIIELQSTLFLAAATIAPEYQILLFFILPVRLKWLAWVSVAFIIWSLIFGSWLGRLYLLVMYANYLLFFGPYFMGRLKAFQRRKKFQHDVMAGKVSEEETHE